jgi:hypothetical protein
VITDDLREEVRLAVYQAFAGEGRAPDLAEFADGRAFAREEVVAALRQLAGERHLVLGEDDGSGYPEILMAHPFSAIPLGFVVMGPRTLWWGGGQVAHFLVPAAHMWDDVVHTCSHQRIFCSTACVDDWLESTGNTRGYVMSLTTLWRLASHWYDGRLQRGYTRREPTASRDYLHEVGLDGPFWTA